MVVHNNPTAGEVGTGRSVGPVPPSLARSESSNQRETLSQETIDETSGTTAKVVLSPPSAHVAHKHTQTCVHKHNIV